MIGRRVAFAAQDERLRAHATGYDPKLSRAGRYGPLAGEPQRVAEMLLEARVIVVAVDRRLADDDLAGEEPLQRPHDQIDHQIPIERRVVLRPIETRDVLVELVRPFG